MSRPLAWTAEQLGCNERTLRRYVGAGMLRGERLGRDEIRLPPREELFLRRSWPLLSRLRQALRTEHSVRLAVLFGSTATGDDRAGSDVDLMVDRVTGDLVEVVQLQRRLSQSLEKAVHIVTLTDAEQSPVLLADILREGRVVVDRDDLWSRLARRRSQVLRQAATEEEATHDAAWNGVAAARARLATR